MASVLDKKLRFVREHVGMFNTAYNFNILVMGTGEEVFRCRVVSQGFFAKLLHLVGLESLVELRTPDGERIVAIRRGVRWPLSIARVEDGNGELLGTFREKSFAVGRKVAVLDSSGNEGYMLVGKGWTNREFRFSAEDRELACVTYEQSGSNNDLPSNSTDNYALIILDDVQSDTSEYRLILAAVVCIDMLLED